MLIFVFLILGSFFIGVNGFEAQHISRQELRKMSMRDMVRIETNPVVIDYQLLRRDFPELLSGMSDDNIREWLLDEASFFRSSQLSSNQAFCDAGECIHGPVKRVDPWQFKKGYISRMTKRAALVSVGNGKFLDLKGSGTEHPLPNAIHSNGVFPLITAVQEFMMSKVVRHIGQAQDEPINTVDCYAVLHVPAWYYPRGFSAVVLGNNTPPGQLRNSPEARHDIAILVRQAMLRPTMLDNYLVPIPMQIRFESALRSWGMTSLSFIFDEFFPAEDHPPAPRFNFFDAQWGRSPVALMDFTHVRFVPLAEARAAQHQPVHSMEAVFHQREGCLRFDNGDILKNESDCAEYILGLTPRWHLPPIVEDGYPANSLFPAGDSKWFESRVDFAAWFDEPERSRIHRLTILSGPLGAISEDPLIYQSIFNHLCARLESWSAQPELENNLDVIF